MVQPMTSETRQRQEPEREGEQPRHYPLFGLAQGEARSFEGDRFDRLRRLEEDVENG